MANDFMRMYRQTLQLGLIKVVQDLFPGENLKIPHSILDGIFCELSDSVVSPREAKLIKARLSEWVQQNNEIKVLGKEGSFYKYDVDGTIIKGICPAFKDPSVIKDFDIIDFLPGFILHFMDDDNNFILPEQLSATFAETQRWLENLHLDKVKDVNEYIKEGRYLELINVAEALHEKKISNIADMILQQKRTVRIILISGPSSSGKTTFAQRLATQLKVNGLKPISLSLDNYFVNRDETPLDEFGQYDFDALEALNLQLLNEQMVQLIKGECVETPIFNFKTGTREPHGNNLQLKYDDILIVEGIHALNPNLLTSINRNYFFNIYISALFQLNIDDYNRVPTTEARLIRRIIRDEQFRGFLPERTLNQWASVRRGENSNVFKYQEEADVMFNSSLLYELNALRSFAEPLLKTVPIESEHYDAAQRLLNLLSFFEPMDIEKVPFNSILREFIGGCVYEH
ncbi:MAG: uridine kinase [Gracilibacter sp. BRH_c7a]|nr:MAG: uridine kinase [Gracilibacter sp. BRH_c7a]